MGRKLLIAVSLSPAAFFETTMNTKSFPTLYLKLSITGFPTYHAGRCADIHSMITTTERVSYSKYRNLPNKILNTLELNLATLGVLY